MGGDEHITSDFMHPLPYFMMRVYGCTKCRIKTNKPEERKTTTNEMEKRWEMLKNVIIKKENCCWRGEGWRGEIGKGRLPSPCGDMP